MKETTKSISEMSDAELVKEMRRRKQAKQDERKTYKELVNETVPTLFVELASASSILTNAKTNIFKAVKDLLELKSKAFDVKNGQQSHTFTSPNGQSITLGYRVTDGWDDTVNDGVAKINEFLQSLAKDEDTANLVSAVNRLLKKDAKGNLKASRVVELQQMSDDFKSPLFDDGVDIIVKGYKPVKSCYFIEASYTDETNKKVNLPLSISSAEFAPDEALDLSFFNTLKS